jgi:hypothetical protein
LLHSYLIMLVYLTLLILHSDFLSFIRQAVAYNIFVKIHPSILISWSYFMKHKHKVNWISYKCMLQARVPVCGVW